MKRFIIVIVFVVQQSAIAVLNPGFGDNDLLVCSSQFADRPLAVFQIKTYSTHDDGLKRFANQNNYQVVGYYTLDGSSRSAVHEASSTASERVYTVVGPADAEKLQVINDDFYTDTLSILREDKFIPLPRYKREVGVEALPRYNGQELMKVIGYDANAQRQRLLFASSYLPDGIYHLEADNGEKLTLFFNQGKDRTASSLEDLSRDIFINVQIYNERLYVRPSETTFRQKSVGGFSSARGAVDDWGIKFEDNSINFDYLIPYVTIEESIKFQFDKDGTLESILSQSSTEETRKFKVIGFQQELIN